MNEESIYSVINNIDRTHFGAIYVLIIPEANAEGDQHVDRTEISTLQDWSRNYKLFSSSASYRV